MAKSAEQIERGIADMRRLGKVISTICTVLLCLTALLAVAIFATVAWRLLDGASQMHGSFAVGDYSVNLLFAVLWFAIFFAFELIARSIARDMARSTSPFTEAHARGIRMLGVAFLLNALCGLLFPGSVVNVVLTPDALGALRFLEVPNSIAFAVGSSGASIDVGSLVGALLSFAVASVWRYGALLQTQTEDLV